MFKAIAFSRRVAVMAETKLNKMDLDSNIAQQLARVASRHQEQRTGHAPKAVTVVLDDNMLVVTLHDALTPAEKALAQSPVGAARVQEFHRQLFANSTDDLRQEIHRITGRRVREAAAEIETTTGTVIHAFTTGAMVQVFLLSPAPLSGHEQLGDAIERADDDGLRIGPDAGFHDNSTPLA
jgi:uncharacterized protein YbcI